eukprot:TRINITY_DN37230_c0_g1_i1.p1 TRINITY_DN37230_c0_g1~~TRINITY_DN37230_c0_g1_i1.p1  ORF type:complete len:280 (+),score=51.80 TRINITY_DN37230_c0_g1_i1:58-840(+)
MKGVQGKKNEKCEHNSWDNVRADKQFLTLRCRLCQKQHRVALNATDWKCSDYNKKKGCQLGDDCPKYHVHYKKQSLEERVRIHGADVVQFVRTPKAEQEFQEQKQKREAAKREARQRKNARKLNEDKDAVRNCLTSEEDDLNSMPSLPTSPVSSPATSPRMMPTEVPSTCQLGNISAPILPASTFTSSIPISAPVPLPQQNQPISIPTTGTFPSLESQLLLLNQQQQLQQHQFTQLPLNYIQTPYVSVFGNGCVPTYGIA